MMFDKGKINYKKLFRLLEIQNNVAYYKEKYFLQQKTVINVSINTLAF